MDYFVNFRNVGDQLLPHFLRKENLLKILYSFLKPLQTLNNNLVAVVSFGQSDISFYQFYLFIKNFLRFTGQTIYLEKYLNSIYDPTNEKIYIENTANSNFTYLYNEIEARSPRYLYNRWRSTTTFAINKYCVFNNQLWISLQNGNLNKQPGSEPLWWAQDTGSPLFLFNSSEAGSQYDFIVYVPASISFDNTKMRKQIDQYRLAGKRYTITIV